MKPFSFNKKMAAAGLAIGLVLGAGGAAFAWLTSTGHGTGSASVGKSAAHALTVSVSNNTTATLAPSALGDPHASTETVHYKVVNAQNADTRLSTVTITVTTGGHAGCTKGWYSITGKPVGTTANQKPGVTLKPSTDATATKTYNGQFTIELVESTNTQMACQTAKPVVTVSAK